MIKFKFTFDKDGEEAWLNGLSGQGWAMTSFFAGFYTFAPCRPGEYVYQIDILPGQGFRSSDPEGYAEFMSNTGVEVVQRWFRWAYLRKRAEDGPFEIYTDTASKIAMYRRIRSMFLWAAILECCCSLSIWPNLFLGGSMFFRVMAAVFLIILSGMFRVVYRCSKSIQKLEREL